MERMQEEAPQLKAEGIVGVNIDEGCYGWSPNVIEFNAVGTAAISIESVWAVLSPQITLDLSQ